MCFKKLMKWTKTVVKKMTVWDVSLLKIYVILIGIIIGAFIPLFVRQYVWWFVAGAVISGIILIKRVLL
jgi:hypothetical protein